MFKQEEQEPLSQTHQAAAPARPQSLEGLAIRRQAMAIFFILMFCYAYVHHGLGWNQNSRLDLLRAIFLHQTFNIDADHENTGDKSIHDGHFYSDKAPAIVFLALPAFAVSLGVLEAFDISVDSEQGWLVSSWITTVGSVGLITALGGAAMFLFLCRLVEQRYAFLATYVAFLGAAPFPYATMLFSHSAVVGLICIALWAIADQRLIHRMTNGDFALSPTEGERERPWLNRYLIAGLCCGLAISSEYTSATAAGGVLALAFLTSWRRGVALALGAILPLLLIPAYNWACFGDPLAFGYHNLARAEFQDMNKGLFGITWPPKADAAYLILFSPQRGLFFWTPAFLLALLGLRILLKWSRIFFWVSFTVAVLQVLFISGYYMPSGGSALGPRHLAPMLPFLTAMLAVAFTQMPNVGFILGYCSLLLTGIGTMINPTPAIEYANPLLEYYLPRMLSMLFTNMIPNHIGISAEVSAIFISIVIAAGYFSALLIPRLERGSNKLSFHIGMVPNKN